MIYGLYLSANGLLTQGMRADVISNNLANGNTHGFKKDFLALRQRDPEVLRQGTLGSQSQRHLLSIGGAVEGDRSHSIFQQGELQKTGNPLDFALNGQGFFKVRSDGGKEFYTRNGAFSLNAQGLLSATNGMNVLSFDGEPIEIGEGSVDVDETGTLYLDGEAVAQIGVFDLPEAGDLHKVGENLFENQGRAQEQPSEAQIKNGHLEQASVSTIREMTSLIEAQRAYQANARLIGIQDETLGKAISQLAT